MSADIVESIDLASIIANNEYREAGNLEPNPVTRLRESQLMTYKDPATRENCSPFELVEIVRSVP